MPAVPGLRSPYALVGRIVHFGRMLDKIRLREAGALPAEYLPHVGDDDPRWADARCCRFLGVKHADLAARIRAGDGELQALAWAHAHGAARTDEDCLVWNRYMMKMGWRDDRTQRLRERVREAGLQDKPIETNFDFIDFDEGRDPVASRAWELRPPLAIVIMGVAGCGKTTVGVKLAQSLGWSFKDADDFHPPANVAKMAAGMPLEDEDRAPWLLAIRGHLEQALGSGQSAVVTCSALKQRYRQVIAPDLDRVKLVYLKGNFELILERIRLRQGHFMKENMLRSQFEALEEPQGALVLDVAQSPDDIVGRIRREFLE